jgi:hypothetical protein
MVGATNRSMAAMSGAWLRRKARHPGEVKAELEQLAMDARRSPRIVDAHPPDQREKVRVDLWSASKGTRFPTPIPAEAGSVPSHEGLGADNRDDLED